MSWLLLILLITTLPYFSLLMGILELPPSLRPGPSMDCYSSFPGPREVHGLVTRTEFATYSELATSVPTVLFRVLTGAEEALLHPF